MKPIQTIESVPHDKCSSFAACIQLCLKKCITMQEDVEAFLFPHIDNDQCIKCGKSYTRCPQISIQQSLPN